MHFYQENTEKNLLKRHHSPQNYYSKNLYSGNFNSCIPILILINKLELVHVKYKSDIKQPKCGYIKTSWGSV